MDTINYKYNIEGGINFYDELNKMLDEEESDTNNIVDNSCLISGQILDKYHFKMDCGHKFNYEPLFKEIIIQKFIFKTYFGGFTNEERKKLNGSKIFIKCPYCRSIQVDILPYYEELGLSKIYGINTLASDIYMNTLGINNLSFNKYNKIFTIGKKCDYQVINIQNINNNCCSCLYVTNLEGTNKNYCINHYYASYKKMIQEEKAKKKDEEKKKKAEEKKKKEEEKQKLKEDKLKEFEAKNAERIAKGLKPLKQQSKLITKIFEPNINTNTNTLVSVNTNEYCIAILSSGLRKGQQCSNKKVTQMYCGRHKSQQEVYNSNINNILS